MPDQDERTARPDRETDTDEALERWLIEEVVPTYDAMRADPSRGIPLQAVLEELRKRATDSRKA